ncbi:MAG TPA: hypothetical protein VFZ28_08855, partial [Burkholderiaceae bacterium]|nr:hypothetical protein [Burkholderiaceae bacterium]
MSSIARRARAAIGGCERLRRTDVAEVEQQRPRFVVQVDRQRAISEGDHPRHLLARPARIERATPAWIRY